MIQLKDKIIELFKFYFNKRIVILLDSIDQLVYTDYDLQWMIYDFPAHVKIIFSTLENHENILDRLKTKITKKDSFLPIEPLNSSNVKTILEDWLSKAERSISNNQWSILDDLFKSATLQPLFIKLIYDIIIKWRSFYEPGVEFKSLQTIDSCIEYLFKQLEKEHGEILFSTCIFYMNAMKNGISESEIEDILSLGYKNLFNLIKILLILIFVII